MDTRHPNLLRLAISMTSGMAVALIALLVAWHTIAPLPNVRHAQWFTQEILSELSRAIPEYQQHTHALPQTLNDLRILKQTYFLPFRKERELLDGWKRPFTYTVTETNYTVTSLGRDGNPGGVGLDCDLTLIDPKPMAAIPTLAQFLFDCPTLGIVLTCIFSGFLTFILCWFLAKPRQWTRQSVVALSAKLLATLIGAILMALLLAVLHIPSGH